MTVLEVTVCARLSIAVPPNASETGGPAVGRVPPREADWSTPALDVPARPVVARREILRRGGGGRAAPPPGAARRAPAGGSGCPGAGGAGGRGRPPAAPSASSRRG